MTIVDGLLIGVVVAALAGIVGYLVWRVRDGKLDQVPPEVHAAAKYVWDTMWLMDPLRMPSLLAVPPRRLNCQGGQGWLRGPNDCIAGSSAPFGNSGSIELAIWPGAKPSETALVHELRHVRRWIEVPGTSLGEPEEAAHASPGFNVDIDAANAVLASRGQ